MRNQLTSNRINQLRKQMLDANVDMLVLAPGAHLSWLTSLQPHADERALLFCITTTHVAFLMPSLEAEAVRPHTDIHFHEWADADGPQAALAELLQSIGSDSIKTLALDECMRADHAALIQDQLPSAKRQFSESTVGALRMRKDEDEYAALKRNALLADTAMQAAWAVMKPGMSETDVADVVRASFSSNQANPLFTIVGAGPNGAFPHHHTGDTKLQKGDAVVMDIGAGRDNYSSDITRMAVIGEPPEGFKDVHAIVNAAVEAALAAAKPGVKAHVVDDAARNVIEQAGFGEFFMHRTGHGLGTEVHEPPYITASSQTVLDEGMVFSIEPGIYLPGRFGIRLEEIVILRSDGPEIFSELPRDIHVIQ